MTHPNELRAPIELTHNTLRDEREQQYVADKRALEDDFHADLAVIQTNKETALAAAGFNPDGSWDPATFATGLPVNTAAPGVPTGTKTSGSTVTAVNGTWQNADSFTYQWQRDGVNIGGATAQTRVLAGADVSHVMRCVITAHNEQGAVSVNSGTFTPAS